MGAARLPMPPLDAGRQRLVTEAWEAAGRMLRRLVAKKWPGLARRAYRVLGVTEFEAACVRGLVEAASRFDPARELKLITYAASYIRRAVQSDLNDRAGMNWTGQGVRLVTATTEDGSLAEWLAVAAPADGGARLDTERLRAAVRAAVLALPPLWRDVVFARWLEKRRIEGAARKAGVTPEQARAVEQMAFRRLRSELASLVRGAA